VSSLALGNCLTVSSMKQSYKQIYNLTSESVLETVLQIYNFTSESVLETVLQSSDERF